MGGRGQHTIVRCGHTGTDSPAWARLVWSLVGSGWVGGVVVVAVGSWVGLFGPWGGSSRSYHTPWSCGRSWSTHDCEMWSHRDGFPGVGSSGLVSGGFWVGRWGGCGCGGLIGRVVWTVGWFLPVVPHPVVVWEVVVNTRLWDVVTPGRIPRRGLVWSGLGGCLGGTVGWLRLRWAHRSGCLDRGVVPPGRTTPRGRVGGRGQHTIVRCGHTGTDSPAWARLVWSLVGSGWVGGVVVVAVGS